MENGHPHPARTSRVPPVSQEETEIRHLAVEHIKNLGDILAENDQWKVLMSQIPGKKCGMKRFSGDDVE